MLAWGTVSPLDDRPATTRVRASAVLMAALAGFALGELVATALIALGAGVAHYPGGLSALAHASAPPWWVNVLSLAGLWSGFAVAIVVATRYAGLAALAHQWRLRASDVLYVGLGVVLQLAVDVAYAPFHLHTFNQPVNHLFGGSRGLSFALLGLLTVIGAPIMEEWFFRGVLFRGLAAATAGAGRWGLAGAVILSALLFALAHGEPLQFAGLAALGVVLAVLVVRTRRLMPSVITHMSFNAVAFAALVAQRGGH